MLKLPARFVRNLVLGITFLATLMLSSILIAHDLYLFPSSFNPVPGTQANIGMHNGDSFPGSDGPPAFERIRDAAVFHAGGTQPIQKLHEKEKAGVGTYTVPNGSYVLATRTIPNLLTLDPTQFEGYLNHEKLDWVIRWRVDNREFAKDGRELYSKHTKALMNLKQDDFALKPIGHPIEIVLLDNPSKAGVGSTVAVNILFQGKPLADQPLEMAWAHAGKTEKRWIGKTGAEGTIRLKLESAGAWKLHTIVMERSKDTAKADWESYWASVTFDVPAKH